MTEKEYKECFRNFIVGIIGLLTMLLLAVLSLSSCKSQKQLIQERTDSIYIEKLVPYELPTDSAAIRAFMECDENGKVVLSWLDIANTKNVQLQFQLDSLGNLKSNFKVIHDTLYLPSKEKVVYKVKVVKEHIPVEKQLSWWQKTRIYLSNLIFLTVLGWGVWHWIKKKFNNK